VGGEVAKRKAATPMDRSRGAGAGAKVDYLPTPPEEEGCISIERSDCAGRALKGP